MRISIVCAACLSFISSAAHGQCVYLGDAKAEAACHARLNFVAALQRAFLKNGMDFEVGLLETRASVHDTRGLYPRLTIFGFINAPIVYQLSTEGGVLKNAQALGFHGVEYSSKGSAGRWLYDISGKTIPRCDINQRLCL